MTGGSLAHLTGGCHAWPACLLSNDAVPGSFRGLSRPPPPSKRDQKFGKRRGVATKLLRSLPTPATFPRAPQLTSDPRSGRRTAEGCITAESSSGLTFQWIFTGTQPGTRPALSAAFILLSCALTLDPVTSPSRVKQNRIITPRP